MEIPVQNIYYLLCYAWDSLKEKDTVDIKSEDCTDLADLFAKVLKSGITHLLKRGIDRNYLGYNNELQLIKGKINFPVSISRNTLSRARLHCDYDEFVHDILHNQLLKKTLYNLINIPELDDSLKKELINIFHYFHSISNINITSKDFRKVKLNRNNRFYSFLLNICELIYENLLPSQEPGKYKFRDFNRDEGMPKLFESFLRNFYKIEKKCYDVSSQYIFWNITGFENTEELIPKMITDITLDSTERKIIIDAKYYKEAFQYNFDVKKFRSENIYQLYAYLKQSEHLGGINKSVEGILLYPTVREEFNQSFYIEGHKLTFASINLNQNWKNIHRDLFSLIE